ncbi:putative Ig domain-containing protein [Nostoc sp. NIES-2111]
MRGFALWLVWCVCAGGQTALVVTPRNLVDGVLGNTYGAVSNGGSVTLPALAFYGITGGTAPYAIRVAAGALPPGIGLQGNGRLDGAPTALGSYTFEIEVTDAAARRVRLTGQRIQVVPPPARTFSGNVGDTFRSGTACNPGALGGTYRYAVAGNLPAGLTLNTNGGISGIPTVAGTFQARWSCTLSGGSEDRQFSTDFVLQIAAPGRVSLAQATVDRPFSFTPSGFTGGTGPFVFSVQGGLTPGLALADAASGRIAGTPTTPGSFNWTLRRVDSTGVARSLQFFQTVVPANATEPPLTLAPAVLSFEGPAGYIGGIVKAFSVSGGAPGRRYALSVGQGAQWLRVGEGATGTSPGAGTVIANLAQMLPGAYEGSLLLTPTGGTGQAGDPVQVPVRLTVGDIQVPELTASPVEVTWEAANDAAPRDFRLQIRNTGGGVASYSVALRLANTQDRGAWISAANARVDLNPGQSAPAIVTLKPRDMRPGVYAARLEVTYGVNNSRVLNIPIRLTVTRVCPVLTFQPDAVRFTARPQTESQFREAAWKWDKEDPKPRWRAQYVPGWEPDRDLIRIYDQPMEGEGSGKLGLSIEPMNWGDEYSSLTNRGGYLQLQWDVEGDCRKRSTLGVGLWIQENPIPLVAPIAVVLPSRNRLTPAGGVDLYIVPQGPGTFDWSAEVVELQSSSLSGNGVLFFGMDQASGRIAPTEDGKTPAPVTLRLEQVPNLQYPGYYSGKILFRFVRANGEERKAFVPIMQIVGSAGSPPPGTPEVPGFQIFQQKQTVPKRAEEESEEPVCRAGVVNVWVPGSQEFALARGQETELRAFLLNECGEVVRDGTLQAEFSNGDRSMELTPGANGIWSGKWIPRKVEEVTAVELIWEREDAKTARTLLSGSVSEGDARAYIEENGFVGAASREPALLVAPGSLLSVRGSRLAKERATSSAGETELGGAKARTEELAAKILAAEPTTLTLQVSEQLQVGRTYDLLLRAEGPETTPVSLAVVSAAPGIYSEDGSGGNQGKVYVVSATGAKTLALGAAGAVAGALVAVEASGLGLVDDTGKVKANVVVLLGSSEQEVKAESAVAVAGRPGVYEVRFRLPAGLAVNQRMPLVLSADGYRSQVVTFSVR